MEPKTSNFLNYVDHSPKRIRQTKINLFLLNTFIIGVFISAVWAIMSIGWIPGLIILSLCFFLNRKRRIRKTNLEQLKMYKNLNKELK